MAPTPSTEKRKDNGYISFTRITGSDTFTSNTDSYFCTQGIDVATYTSWGGTTTGNYTLPIRRTRIPPPPKPERLIVPDDEEI